MELEDGIAAFEKHDFNTAVRLIEPLAEQGNIEAEYFMGTFYMYGHGVAMDPPQATVWFKRAYGHWETQARAGDPAAMVEVAGMLTSGLGVPIVTTRPPPTGCARPAIWAMPKPGRSWAGCTWKGPACPRTWPKASGC